MLNPAATYLRRDTQGKMPVSRTATDGLSDHRSVRSDDDDYPNSETELESKGQKGVCLFAFPPCHNLCFHDIHKEGNM